MACNRSTVETDGKSYWHYDYADQTPLPGTYTLTFTIPEVSDAGAVSYTPLDVSKRQARRRDSLVLAYLWHHNILRGASS